MEIILMLATLISPVVLALVELVKRTVNLPKKYLPLLALALGLFVGGLSFPLTDLDLATRLWAGGLAGLSATGLFELSKNREGTTFDRRKE
ncbi:holin [Alkalicoccobacillus murimartini]|uniref:Holin n=1 Tax=Alkalicoccobacillus murimartini TaxID=171685 RepID=A0ABT9YEA7_9BACI|nr:holin [Alkalicoccobacillus murimartini]MDQ0205830.1 hypothetical protein [Alkalicoccobacillus murimartini]